ncbi:hypothetical protein H261_01307 [Paramagnetospirillum caucaseum]|uniref:Uncharacterized protein n=1 Tax=Paramagnetospirillum caucaseum TaxID=1244869 RepID=M3AGZ2_9PROT|nr:hypothetical protein [Paramagnetospirillum caucaseum]EME71844.1 hypothetical protein H261_01307 [Paramagnetospirillum caucaseum]
MPKTQVREGLSRLVVYQTGIPQIVRSDFAVLLDDGAICYMVPGEVMVRDIRAGQHKIAFDNPMTAGTSVLSFTAEAGKTVYISAAPNARSVVASLLLGPLADLATSDKTTARGGSVFLEQSTSEQAEQDVATLSKSSCTPPGA